MRMLDADEAKARMNGWGREGRPFLFVIDYEGRMAFVEPLEELDPEEVLFRFPGWGNDDGLPTGSRPPFSWQAFPEPLAAYREKFGHVVEQLRLGNSYLVNLTCQVPVETSLTTRDIYGLAQAPYRLWLKDRFVCFSPETFVRIGEGRICSFPMKGTACADRPGALKALMDNPKEAAEHATVVDLIRNDLSLVAHGVTVSRYRYAERIETSRGPLYQTSSEISGLLPSDYPSRMGDIVFSQLPAGSVTGAPKPSTCQIIRAAEDYARGFYTGVMGVCAHGTLESAVMIRFVQEDGGRLFYKAGGGITAKSRCEDEYNEIIQKIYVPVC